MVRLDRISTRSGDAGETSLGDGSRVSKRDPRIAAGGTVDELNSLIGAAMCVTQDDEQRRLLERIQQRLFDLGADLSCPLPTDSTREDRVPRIGEHHIAWLDAELDRANDQLSPLTSFVLPGGTPSAAALHVARAVCRRAERDVLQLPSDKTVNPRIAVFLNRLSDVLFVLARIANDCGSLDVLWQPGSD
ncbi:MAG: cob(I)yrinic acid a,c-diamide adenosyltransferase [Planctomycetaceae bacterium]